MNKLIQFIKTINSETSGNFYKSIRLFVSIIIALIWYFFLSSNWFDGHLQFITATWVWMLSYGILGLIPKFFKSMEKYIIVISNSYRKVYCDGKTDSKIKF